MPREPSEATVATTETDPAALVPALRAFAWSFRSNPAEADDLVRKTLTKASADAHQFKPGTSVNPWLFRIMRDIFYAGHMSTLQDVPARPDHRTGEVDPRPGQEWSLRNKELTQAIRMLPRSQREVLVLTGVLGLSDREAAEICGCDVATVNSRLSSARSRLVEALKGRPSRRSMAKSPTPVSAAGPQCSAQIQRV